MGVSPSWYQLDPPPTAQPLPHASTVVLFECLSFSSCHRSFTSFKRHWRVWIQSSQWNHTSVPMKCPSMGLCWYTLVLKVAGRRILPEGAVSGKSGFLYNQTQMNIWWTVFLRLLKHLRYLHIYLGIPLFLCYFMIVIILQLIIWWRLTAELVDSSRIKADEQNCSLKDEEGRQNVYRVHAWAVDNLRALARAKTSSNPSPFLKLQYCSSTSCLESNIHCFHLVLRSVLWKRERASEQGT